MMVPARDAIWVGKHLVMADGVWVVTAFIPGRYPSIAGVPHLEVYLSNGDVIYIPEALPMEES